ncbi:hypothetical protein ACIQUQ_06970 [Streptomyces sp. NPDC101118]|uniref:hypothetical protein n=1 Tax=Streptomyces sp. NPDC101118 TaxID=3366109 RepID=UPI003818D26E
MGSPRGSEPPGWGERPPVPPGGAWAPPPAPPRKDSSRACCLTVGLVVGGLGLLAAIGIGALAFREAPGPGPHRPADDVRITACETDPTTRWPHADLTITNHSGKASDYWIGVEFVAASGERLAEANASTSHLAPGQASRERAQSLTQVDRAVTCRITDVTRTAS